MHTDEQTPDDNRGFIATYLGPDYLPGLGGRTPELLEVLQAVKARRIKRALLELVTADVLCKAIASEGESG